MVWLKSNWLKRDRHKLHRREPVHRERNARRHAIRIVIIAAILFGALPAWPQNEGAGAPNPENALAASPFAGFMSRFSRPQSAQAAPSAARIQTSRIRMSRPKQRASAPAPQGAIAAAQAQPQSQPPEPLLTGSEAQQWPIAQESVGAAGLVPVEIKTVREMVEAEAETSLVRQNELSDLDLAAQPVSRLDEAFSGTDGRAHTDEGEARTNRIAAFAENLKAIATAAWLEPMLLALAGAIAAVTAMRVFAS